MKKDKLILLPESVSVFSKYDDFMLLDLCSLEGIAGQARNDVLRMFRYDILRVTYSAKKSRTGIGENCAENTLK